MTELYCFSCCCSFWCFCCFFFLDIMKCFWPVKVLLHFFHYFTHRGTIC